MSWCWTSARLEPLSGPAHIWWTMEPASKPLISSSAAALLAGAHWCLLMLTLGSGTWGTNQSGVYTLQGPLYTNHSPQITNSRWDLTCTAEVLQQPYTAQGANANPQLTLIACGAPSTSHIKELPVSSVSKWIILLPILRCFVQFLGRDACNCLTHDTQTGCLLGVLQESSFETVLAFLCIRKLQETVCGTT